MIVWIGHGISEFSGNGRDACRHHQAIALNQCRGRERSTRFECEQQGANAVDLHGLPGSDCRMSGAVDLDGFQRAAESR